MSKDLHYKIGEARTIIHIFLTEPQGIEKDAIRELAKEWLADDKCDCGESGSERVDNGLKAGIHCDVCWEKLVADCRKRSY